MEIDFKLLVTENEGLLKTMKRDCTHRRAVLTCFYISLLVCWRLEPYGICTSEPRTCVWLGR
jgi:hypothetical protein